MSRHVDKPRHEVNVKILRVEQLDRSQSVWWLRRARWDGLDMLNVKTRDSDWVKRHRMMQEVEGMCQKMPEVDLLGLC